MMEKLSYQKILNAFDAFRNDLAEAKLGWKLSLYISKNIDYLSPHVEHYNKANAEIIMEYSIETEVEGKVARVVESKNIAQFQTNTQELLNTVVEIDYDKIDINSLSVQDQEKLDEFVTPKILQSIKYTFKE